MACLLVTKAKTTTLPTDKFVVTVAQQQASWYPTLVLLQGSHEGMLVEGGRVTAHTRSRACCVQGLMERMCVLDQRTCACGAESHHKHTGVVHTQRACMTAAHSQEQGREGERDESQGRPLRVNTRLPLSLTPPSCGAQVEWAHVIIGRDEKVYMSVAAVAGAVTAFSLLVWVGPAALAVNTAAATEEFTLRVAAVVRARVPRLPADALQPVTEPGPMGTVLALVGGMLGESVSGINQLLFSHCANRGSGAVLLQAGRRGMFTGIALLQGGRQTPGVLPC